MSEPIPYSYVEPVPVVSPRPLHPVRENGTVELDLSAGLERNELTEVGRESDTDTEVLPRVVDGTVVSSAEEGERLGWLRRNAVKLAIGATVLSAALSLAFNPLAEVMDPIEAKLPAVAVGMIAMDAIWAISGLVAYRLAVGEWKNPFKVTKDEWVDAAVRGYNSRAFRTAFAVNTAAATAFFAIPAVVVGTNLPVESWGVLGLPALEFSSTVALRVAIIKKLREHGRQSVE